MLISIDIDVHSSDSILQVLERIFKFFRTYFAGLIVLGKRPSKIKESSGGHGYHFTYYNIDCDEDESFLIRRKLFEDKNRLRLDMLSWKRMNQVAFTEKEFDVWDISNSEKYRDLEIMIRRNSLGENNVQV